MDTEKDIKKLRMDMGMNRREFCEFYEIPYRTVSDWEAGKRKMPDYVFRLLEYRAKMEILRTLEKAEEDVKNGRIATVDSDYFDSLKESLKQNADL